MICQKFLRTISCLGFLVTLVEAATYLRKTEGAELAVQQRSAVPQHRLRVCNAYPYQTPLNIYIGDSQITDPAMTYKECREFEPQLHAGDRLDFRFLESSAGTFVVKDLPASDAVLMLVIYRQGVDTTSVAFESHVFANLLNAQIAVLDTYKGQEKADLRIQDLQEADTARSEKLSPNTVVAVNAGKYEVVLTNPDGTTKARSDLTVENRESSVVIRCGVQPLEGRAYPQELIVYPVNPPKRKERKTERMVSEADRIAHLPRAAPVAAIVAVSFGILVVAVFAAFALRQ